MCTQLLQHHWAGGKGAHRPSPTHVPGGPAQSNPSAIAPGQEALWSLCSSSGTEASHPKQLSHEKRKVVSGRTHWAYTRSSQAQTSCKDQLVFSFPLLCTNRSTSSNAPSTLAHTSNLIPAGSRADWRPSTSLTSFSFRGNINFFTFLNHIMPMIGF